MKCIYAFLLLCFYTSTYAQIQDLTENDSISWIAEWEADYLIDDFDAADTILNNRLYGIKYLNQAEFGFRETKRFFAINLWEAVSNNEIETFSDKDFKKPLKNEAALYSGKARAWFNKETDIDPIAYDTRFVTYTSHDAKEIMFYRVRQIIYYNVHKAQFQMRILAIAPLIEQVVNDTSELIYLEPLFWFKPEMDKPFIHSENITWAQGLSSTENSLVFSKAKILKNVLSDTLVNHFLNSFEKRLDIPFWQINNDGNSLEKIENQQRWSILNPVDTIIPVELLHYEKEKFKLNQLHYTAQDFKFLRLHQEWYWDNHQHKLFIDLKKVALMLQINDDTGNFLFLKPLFYRKTDD